MDHSTIAAIATPSGSGGIGIIKISGPAAISIAGALFRHRKSGAGTDSATPAKSSAPNNGFFQSHRLYYGHIVDPDSGTILDEVLLSVMKAPQSYTREHVVEINSHGGRIVLQAILSQVLKQGARLAAPGEFTQRAFLNGRIDLTQAEAVIDIINAQTEKSLQIATAQIDGQLRKKVEAVREALVAFLAQTEAAIDFPEAVEDMVDPESVVVDIQQNIIYPLEGLIQRYIDSRVLREGLNVAVVGKPNVGKSSLMNQLIQKDRAIVTAIPGTTRDIIEEALTIQGVPVILSDTAGLHETDDPVEIIGIEKTIAHVNGADVVLFLAEANQPLTDEDDRIYDKVRSKPVIIALNKIDLVRHPPPAVIPDTWTGSPHVYISALYGQGIDHLKDMIVKTARGDHPVDLGETLVPSLRHRIALEKSLAAAHAILKQFNDGNAAELIAIHIQEASDALGEILGTNVKIDVLDQIFSRFCIGK